MSGIIDRLTRGLLARNKPDAPGPGSKVEAGPGAGPHDPLPDPSNEYSLERDASEDPGFGDGTPGSDVSEYRRGDAAGSPERDIGEYRRGDAAGSPERDISEYRDGNAMPPSEGGELAYRSEDVVIPEPPESGPVQARMTDTVAGSDADAGSPIDGAGASVADAGAADSPLGSADIIGAPTESASAGGIPTQDVSLNYEEVEAEYFDGDKGGTTASVTGRYDVQEQGEGSRDADEADGGAPAETVETGGLAYRSDDVASDSPESRPAQARMTDTVAEDDKEKSTDDGGSGDKDSGEPPAGTGPTGPLNASHAASLDGGGAVEYEEVPLTLMDFKVTEDALPAVIEDTGADLGTEALPDLGELGGADEDDAPPVE